MKQDILEQLVDDFLQANGYFTRRNIKFKPDVSHPDFIRNQDSNHSDIDVLGLHPRNEGYERVWVVSCKSWQAGFNVRSKIDELENDKVRSGREVWKAFRELMQPKWTDALFKAVENETGTSKFTYVTAVTSIKGDRLLWETHPRFRNALRGNPIRLISFSDMLEGLLPKLTTTLASSDLTRTLQLIRASGYKIIPGPL